jgi:hypothetical protein
MTKRLLPRSPLKTKENKMFPVINQIPKFISSIVPGHVYETKDYDNIFFIKGNRPIIDSHVQGISSSMLAIGWLMTSMCLMVIIKNKLYSLCGQHRVKAAKLADIPIRFILTNNYEKDDENTIRQVLSAIQKDSAEMVAWETAAYLHSFCEWKAKQYLDLKYWMERNQINNIETSLILMGKDNSSKMLKDFREGLFEMGNVFLAEERLSQIRQIASMGRASHKFKFVFNRNFVRAYCQVGLLPDYNHKEFIRILGFDRQNAMFLKQPDIVSYKKLMQDIYNFGKARENKKFFV